MCLQSWMPWPSCLRLLKSQLLRSASFHPSAISIQHNLLSIASLYPLFGPSLHFTSFPGTEIPECAAQSGHVLTNIMSKSLSTHFASLQLDSCPSLTCSAFSGIHRVFHLKSGSACYGDWLFVIFTRLNSGMKRPMRLVQAYVESAKAYFMPLWEDAEIIKLWNESYRDSGSREKSTHC